MTSIGRPSSLNLQLLPSPHGLAVRTPAFHAGDRRFESGWGYYRLSLVGRGFWGSSRLAWVFMVERATVPRNGLRAGGGITVTSGGAEGKSAGAEPPASIPPWIAAWPEHFAIAELLSATDQRGQTARAQPRDRTLGKRVNRWDGVLADDDTRESRGFRQGREGRQGDPMPYGRSKRVSLMAATGVRGDCRN
jgi:hypothetical protein